MDKKNKLARETFYLLILLASILFSILSFILYELYVPEFFEYIYRNWDSGFANIVLKTPCASDNLNLLKNEKISLSRNHTRDFFNNLIKYPYTSLNQEKNPSIYNLSIKNFKVLPIGLSYCFDNTETYFKLIKENNNTHLLYKNQTNFKLYKYIDSLGNMVYNPRYSDSYFITDQYKYSEARITQGPPCLDPRYLNLNMTFDKTSYYYGRSQCPGGKINKRYVHISKLRTNITKLSELNGWNISHIPEKYRNEYLTVYARTFIGIKDHCWNKTFGSYEEMTKNNIQVNNIIIYLGYVNIIEIIFLLLFLNRYIVKYNKYKNKNKSSCYPSYTNPLLIIVSVIITSIHVIIFLKEKELIELIKNFADSSCFDEEVPELINKDWYYLVFGGITQILSLIGSTLLALRYGIRKSIKYAN